MNERILQLRSDPDYIAQQVQSVVDCVDALNLETDSMQAACHAKWLGIVLESDDTWLRDLLTTAQRDSVVNALALYMARTL
jgi:hypothetical protein